LEGVKSALLAAKHTSSAGSTFGRVETASTAVDNRKWTNEEKTIGLKAFGRGYAGWGFSQAFYRERLHEKGSMPASFTSSLPPHSQNIQAHRLTYFSS